MALRELETTTYLEEGLPFSWIHVADILFPLKEGLLINDVKLVAVDERLEEGPLRKAEVVSPNLKPTSKRCNTTIDTKILRRLNFFIQATV